MIFGQIKFGKKVNEMKSNKKNNLSYFIDKWIDKNDRTQWTG